MFHIKSANPHLVFVHYIPQQTPRIVIVWLH